MMEQNQRNLIEYIDFNPRYIVEVGSRDGNEAKCFAKTYPKAQIFSFECNPDTLPKCRKASIECGYTLIESAVSDKDGQVTFYPIDTEKTETTHLDGNPGASSMLIASGRYPVERYVQKQMKVPSMTLKSFMKEYEIPQIDILWMDAQGSELMVLKGLGNKIHKVRLVHTEVEFFPIYQDQPLFADIDFFLKSKGFKFIGFTAKDTYAADALYTR